MLVDSHCHLGSEQFTEDLEAVIARAWEAGVGHIVVIGESPAAAARALALAAPIGASRRPRDSTRTRPGAGRRRPALARGRLATSRCVAAGEMGLDYHYDHAPRHGPARGVRSPARTGDGGAARRS